MSLPVALKNELKGYKKIAEKKGTIVFRKKKRILKIQEIPRDFHIQGIDDMSKILVALRDKQIQSIRDYKILPDNNKFFSGSAIVLEMDYLQGITLDKFCTKKVPRIIKEDLIIKILKSLKKCHDLGVLHRDLKLENVWVNKSFFGFYPILTDFNLFYSKSKIFAAPEYLAPETNNSSEYSITSEIWSLGVLVFFILHGYFPVKSRNDGLKIDEARNEVKNYDYASLIGQMQESKFKSFFQKSLNPNPAERATDLHQLLNLIGN